MPRGLTTAFEPKYRQMRNRLLARIQSGQYPVGSRLPKIAEMGDEFGVSYVTAQRAYRLLAEEGILSSTKGPTGTRVLRPSLPKQTRQLVVAGFFRPVRAWNELDNYGLDMFETVCGELAERHVSMIHHRTNDTGATEELLGRISRRELDGVILDQLVPDDDLKTIVRTGVPVVMYNRHPETTIVDSVCPDMEWIGRETARRALESGCQRVILCEVWRREEHDDPEGRTRRPTYQNYVDGACAALKESGLPDEQIVIRYQPPRGPAHRWQEEDFFCEWMGIPAHPDGLRTLYATSSDRSALRVRDALEKRGFRVPQDAGVIGLFNFKCNKTGNRPVTSWAIDPFEVGRTAVEMLMERIEFPKRKHVRRYLKPEFVDHGTL